MVNVKQMKIIQIIIGMQGNLLLLIESQVLHTRLSLINMEIWLDNEFCHKPSFPLYKLTDPYLLSCQPTPFL